MTHDEYLQSIGADSAAITAVATGRLDVQVPSCPEWDMEALVGHVGRAHRWARANLDRAVGDGPAYLTGPVPTEGESVLEWLRQQSTVLIDRLRALGPSHECWTWTEDQTSGFWASRMAFETAAHRWDAQHAVGQTQPLEPALAVEAVGELFHVLRRLGPSHTPSGDGETIHLHATDAPGEWLVTLVPGGYEVTREHAKGDAAARGTASDLALFVLGRVPPSSLEVFGDSSLLDRWQEQAKF